MSEAATAAFVTIIGILAIGGIAYLGFRISDASTLTLKRRVFEVNRALADAGERCGLRYVGGGTWQHPVMGLIPGYGSLHGVYRGREVHVSVVQNDDEARLTIEIMAAERIKLARKTAPDVATALEAAGATLRIEEDRVLVTPARGNWSHDTLVKEGTFDASAIRTTLDLAVSTVSQLETAS